VHRPRSVSNFLGVETSSAALKDPSTASSPRGLSGREESLLLREALEAAVGPEFDDKHLAESIALFEMGDFAGCLTKATEAEAAIRELAASKDGHGTGAGARGGETDAGSDDSSDLGTVNMSSSDPAPQDNLRCASRETVKLGAKEDSPKNSNDWKACLSSLAVAYVDQYQPEEAEALYLRMLAWREGVEQYRTGQFDVADKLFQKSPEYASVEDATWFLNRLRPDDGHVVSEVVGLLALGNQVAAKAAVAVYTLALKPKQRPRITDCGGLELVAKAVATHPENAELQAAGCGALKLLCRGHAKAPRNKRALMDTLGGAEALATSMRSHPQDPEVQREACGAMHAAASQHPAGARRFVEIDGMVLCIDAIVGCPNDAAVGDAACRALGALQCAGQASAGIADAAAEDFEAVWDARLRSERGRCLAYSEAELRRYLPCDDIPVIQALLNAVTVLLEDASVRHRALTVVEPVVAAMKKYPAQAPVQVPACGILWHLTAGHLSRGEAAAMVADSGGVLALVQAMRDLPCNAELQRLAISATQRVAFGNDPHKTLAVQAGAVPATVTAMLRYPRDAQLQEDAIGCLTSLCDLIGRAATLARLGGIEAIIAAMQRHGHVGHVGELGCIILCIFCDDAGLRHQMISSGAKDIAKTLSRSEAPEVRKWGHNLLRELQD